MFSRSLLFHILVVSTGLSISAPSYEPFHEGGQCYFSPSLRPIESRVCDQEMDMESKDKTCSILYATSGTKLFFKGWSLGPLEKNEPVGIVLPSLTPATAHTSDACLCELWARFPSYVIWEDGNPCGASIS